MARAWRWGLAGLVAVGIAGPARAERPPEPKGEADLVVVGRVERVYSHADATDLNYLVAIEVQSVEKGRGAESGQVVDARCFRRRPEAPRVPAAYGHRQFPAEGQTIRAYLMRRPNGTYEGCYPDWVESAGGSRRLLGVYTRPIALGDQAGLQITALVPGGAAQAAGLEPGDILLAASGEPTRTQEDLTRLVSQAGPTLRVRIRNVRNGAIQDLDVALPPAD